MTVDVGEITQAALSLPEHDRAVLAGTLLDSLDAPAEDPAEIQAAWTSEIRSRVDDILTGRVETISYLQIKAEVAERRAAKLRAR